MNKYFRMSPKIIAICGVMRSGKDTIANHLVENYGYENVKIADTLKRVVSILFGFSHDQIEGNAKDKVDDHWGITPRAAMQFFGTEIMQYQIQRLCPDIGRTFWMSSLCAKLNALPKDKQFVISDLRFVHEYEYLVKTFGIENVYVMKVSRTNLPLNVGCQHVSERDYEAIPENIKICNDDTLPSLYKKIDDIMANQNPQRDDLKAY